MLPRLSLRTRLWLAWRVIRGEMRDARADFHEGTLTITFENARAVRERLFR